jgi:predicted amidohydrolase
MKKSIIAALAIGLMFVASAVTAQAENREPEGNYSSRKYLKVAVIAFSPPGDAPVDVPKSVIDRYKERTADNLEDDIRAAANNGAKYIATPEFGTVGYPDIPELSDEEDEFQNRGQIKPYLEKLNGKTVTRFGKLAKELKVWLTVGIAEIGNDGGYYNTLVVLNDSGKVETSYRKINLFEGETHFLDAGDERVYFEHPEIGRVGLMTCYDIWFANPAFNLVNKDGIQVMSFSTSWVGDDGIKAFQSFAKKNEVYFMAANHTYFPDSGVIDPKGKIQSHIRSQSGAAYGYIKKIK